MIETKQLLEAVLNSVSEAILVHDKRGRIVLFNRRVLDLFGVPEERCLDISVTNLSAPDAPIDTLSGLWSEVIAGGERHFQWHSRRLSDGTLFFTDVSLSRIVLNGEPMVLAVVRDISDLLERESRLLERSDFIEGIINNLPNPIFIKDGAHRWQVVNRSFVELIGRSKEELIGRSDYDFLPKEQADVFWQKDDLVMRSGQMNENEESINNAAGETRTIITRKIPWVRENGETWLLAVITDITARKQMEEQLLKAKLEAEEAARIKGDFLANMSHEIRTPMNGVIGSLELLSHSKLDAEQKDLVEIAKNSGDVLLTLINQVLDLSKIEAGKFSIITAPFCLRESLDELAGILKPLLLEKGIELHVEIGSAVPAYLLGDFPLIRQVLLNLLSNAAKFSIRGGVIVLLVDQAQTHSGAQIDFSVIDTGIGIDPADFPKIFEAFEQLDSSTTRRYGGTGLGLTISKRLAGLMGGGLAARGRRGLGSVFTLSLPLSEVSQQDFRNAQQKLKPASLPKGLRILVAEDSTVNQRLLQAMLQREGCIVSVASNGAEALKLARSSAYDLIMLDIQMPVLDGPGTLKQLHESPPGYNAPVIALTAHALKGDREKYINEGFNGYVAKPFSRESLFTEIARLTRR